MFFLQRDGEMLIVPQQGRLLLRTEMGILEAAPGEIAVIQRGIRFRVELLDKRRAATSARTTARCCVYPIWADWRERTGESARLSGASGEL